MTENPPESTTPQSFPPTSGTLTGWIAVIGAAAGTVVVLATDRSLDGLRFGLGIALFGVLAWCFLLRPRLVIDETFVELRNAFSSWHVPLVRIRNVVVRAITRVHTEERHFDGVAVGRPVRSMMRAGLDDPQRTSGGRPRSADVTADLVADQILLAVERARLDGRPAPEPRRTWALPEIAAALVLVVALGVSLLV